MSDTLGLLADAQAGDRAAFDRLLARHRGRLTAFVASRMPAALRATLDPDDVVQETLLEAARKLDGFVAQRPQGFYAWLVRIADFKLKEADRHRRAKKRGHPVELRVEPSADQTSVLGRLGRGERARRIAQALEELPETQAEAVRRRYLEGLSVAETAEKLGKTPAAVKSLVARGLTQLASLLDGRV